MVTVSPLSAFVHRINLGFGESSNTVYTLYPIVEGNEVLRVDESVAMYVS